MNQTIILTTIDNARVYYNSRHVGTIGVAQSIFAGLSLDVIECSVDVYICQSEKRGYVYEDKKGFPFSYYLFGFSEVADEIDLFVSRCGKGNKNALRKILIETVQGLGFNCDTILFSTELTLYDL